MATVPQPERLAVNTTHRETLSSSTEEGTVPASH